MKEYRAQCLIDGSAALEVPAQAPSAPRGACAGGVSLRRVSGRRGAHAAPSAARIAYDALGFEEVARGMKEGSAAGNPNVKAVTPATVLFAAAILVIFCAAALL